MGRWVLLFVACMAFSASCGAYVGSVTASREKPKPVEECLFGFIYLATTDGGPSVIDNITTDEIARVCEFPVADLNQIRDELQKAAES